MEVKGAPPEDLMEKATRKKNFFLADNSPIIAANSRGKVRYPGSRNLQ